MKYDILQGKNVSMSALAKDNTLDIALENTARGMPYNDEKAVIDHSVVYADEAAACNQFRLVLLIKPYCTNVLFNTVTEVVKNEGSPNVERVWDGDSGSTTLISGADGYKFPTRQQMVANTEYSKSAIGYEYLPGLDIFDNHLFRSTDFQVVNKYKGVSNERFNTHADLARYSDGSPMPFATRTADSPTDPFVVTTLSSRHMYNVDNFLTFDESIAQNLAEDNGWLGFVNTARIQSLVSDSGYADLQSKDISKVINNRGSCEFVDMYPGRDLYSFTPKFNPYRKRLEYNWNITLTYPYRIEQPSFLKCVDEDSNPFYAIPICGIKSTTSGTGSTTVRLRSYFKHNLSRNDKVQLYYIVVSNGGQYMRKFANPSNVIDVGNSFRKYPDYYFAIAETDLEDNGLTVSDIQINRIKLVFRHVVDDTLSDYYVRIFKKIPNLKRRKKNLTAEVAADYSQMRDYIENNATRADATNKMYEFDREQRPAAFTSTIYADDVTEVVFTDTIDLTHIRDHRNRPLTNIYATIVKNNKGYEEWYVNKGKYAEENVEYSHCFGPITSGFELHSEEGDLSGEDATYFKEVLESTGCDVNKIHNCLYSKYSKPLGHQDINVSCARLTIDGYKCESMHDEFYGDLVEFMPTRQMEYVLEGVHHRFNTAQRELIGLLEDAAPSAAIYHNIINDDYDDAEWATEDLEIPDCFNRPEGYYYQAHYQIPVRSVGPVQQGEYRELSILSARPVILDKMYIQVTCNTRHKLSVSDYIRIKDGDGSPLYLPVVYILDQCKFAVPATAAGDGVSYSVDNLMNWLTNDEWKVCVYSPDIPSWATEITDNVYMWRDVIQTSESTDEAVASYPYANNHFYIEKDINFFLRRQDPHKTNGLYCVADDGITNASDPEGKHKSESNYDYVPEGAVPC